MKKNILTVETFSKLDYLPIFVSERSTTLSVENIYLFDNNSCVLFDNKVFEFPNILVPTLSLNENIEMSVFAFPKDFKGFLIRKTFNQNSSKWILDITIFPFLNVKIEKILDFFSENEVESINLKYLDVNLKEKDFKELYLYGIDYQFIRELNNLWSKYHLDHTELFNFEIKEKTKSYSHTSIP